MDFEMEYTTFHPTMKCNVKAECLKSKKDGRVLPIFNSNLATLPKPRLYFHKILCVMLLELCTRWKNFASPFRFGSASTTNVLDIRHKTVSPSKNVSPVVRTIHTKDAQKKKQNSPNVPPVQGHMLHLTRGVLNIKSRHSGQQPKNLCRRSKPKISIIAQNSTNFSIYCRTAHQICSQCGHPNSPAIGVLD